MSRCFENVCAKLDIYYEEIKLSRFNCSPFSFEGKMNSCQMFSATGLTIDFNILFKTGIYTISAF